MTKRSKVVFIALLLRAFFSMHALTEKILPRAVFKVYRLGFGVQAVKPDEIPARIMERIHSETDRIAGKLQKNAGRTGLRLLGEARLAWPKPALEYRLMRRAYTGRKFQQIDGSEKPNWGVHKHE